MTEAQDTQPLALPATAGAWLRDARESRGMAIETLAASLKISVQQLRDLEDDRHERLSDAAFTRALTMSVCRLLKVDPAPALAMLPPAVSTSLLEQVNRGLNEPFESASSAGAVGAGWRTLWRQPAGLMLVAFALLALWMLKPLLKPVPTQAPRLSAAAPQASTVAPASGAGAASDLASPADEQASASTVSSALAPVGSASGPPAVLPAASGPPAHAGTPPAPSASPGSASAARSPASAGATLLIVARAASWVEVRSGSRVLVSQLLPARGQVTLDAARPLSVTVGDAQATDVVYRGHAIDLSAYTRDHVAHLELTP